MTASCVIPKIEKAPGPFLADGAADSAADFSGRRPESQQRRGG